MFLNAFKIIIYPSINKFHKHYAPNFLSSCTIVHRKISSNWTKGLHIDIDGNSIDEHNRYDPVQINFEQRLIHFLDLPGEQPSHELFERLIQNYISKKRPSNIRRKRNNMDTCFNQILSKVYKDGKDYLSTKYDSDKHTCIHEAGHVITMLKTPYPRNFQSVHITEEGGHVKPNLYLSLVDRSRVVSELAGCLGGIAAEKEFYNRKAGLGALSDILQAVELSVKFSNAQVAIGSEHMKSELESEKFFSKLFHESINMSEIIVKVYRREIQILATELGRTRSLTFSSVRELLMHTDDRRNL